MPRKPHDAGQAEQRPLFLQRMKVEGALISGDSAGQITWEIFNEDNLGDLQ